MGTSVVSGAGRARPFAVVEGELRVHDRTREPRRLTSVGSDSRARSAGPIATRGGARRGAALRGQVAASDGDVPESTLAEPTPGGGRSRRARHRGGVRLARALAGTTLGDLTELALACHMSRGEVLAVSAEQVNLRLGHVSVEWEIAGHSRAPAMIRSGTTGRRRLAGLDEAFLRRLRVRVGLAVGHPACVTPDGREAHLLFVRDDGRPLGLGSLAALWRDFVQTRSAELGLAPHARHRDVENTFGHEVLDRRGRRSDRPRRSTRATRIPAAVLTEVRHAHESPRRQPAPR